jgi:rhamnosyltransferase
MFVNSMNHLIKMKIISIIVVYNAKESAIRSLHQSLVNQVDNLIFVKNDNSNSEWISRLLHSFLIDLKKNMGIAYAQNRGIETAIKLGAEWVLFSDQDTVYPNDYIFRIFNTVLDKGLENIGALTPVFYDEVKKQYAKIMLTKTKAVFPELGKIYEVAHSISSGTLVPIKVIQKVGLMKEELFIDFVDFEWCWRLEKKGLKIYCLSAVVIHHQLGDSLKNIAGIKVVSRKLFRFYYIIRNGYYLITAGYLNGRDYFLYQILMLKKIFETILLNNFSKESIRVVRKAIYNGRHSNFTRYEDL